MSSNIPVYRSLVFEIRLEGIERLRTAMRLCHGALWLALERVARM